MVRLRLFMTGDLLPFLIFMAFLFCLMFVALHSPERDYPTPTVSPSPNSFHCDRWRYVNCQLKAEWRTA